MNFFSKYNMFNLALYAAFGFILGACGVSAMDNPLGFFSLMGILVVVDCASYKKGLNRGCDIAKEVWGIK